MTERVALVTGASSGIGEATALALNAAGWTVYAAARRTHRMTALTERGITVAAVDVTDDASMVALVDEVLSSSGRIDALVNNAGYGSYGAVEDTPIDEGRRQFEVNVFGLARMTQLVLPHLRAQGSGCIVNVSSMGGRIWEPLGAWYHATKFAVEGFSDSLRAEVAPFGIDVVVIQPGMIRTEWGVIAADGLEERSAGSAYGAEAGLVAAALRSTAGSTLAADPAEVAAVIAHALGRRRPRTRYPAAGHARAFLVAQRLLPDRGFDAFIRFVYRVGSR